MLCNCPRKKKRSRKKKEENCIIAGHCCVTVWEIDSTTTHSISVQCSYFRNSWFQKRKSWGKSYYLPQAIQWTGQQMKLHHWQTPMNRTTTRNLSWSTIFNFERFRKVLWNLISFTSSLIAKLNKLTSLDPGISAAVKNRTTPG